MSTESPHSPSSSTAAILTVEHLTVGYQAGAGWLDAVRDVSLSFGAAQTYGIVGESGSGKSTLVQAIMRYLGPSGAIRGGRIVLDGEDITGRSPAEMRDIWGARLSMVPQDPLSSLNPSIVIGEQIAEVNRLHGGLDRDAAYRQALATLRSVRIADAEDVARRYPHQLSGGMQQRVAIAMALSTNPRVLVLDEPTTALDVTTEAAVLSLFDELLARNDSATIFVTHNLGIVARMCDRVAVLYAGELMEDADVESLYARPLHPYTMSLLGCVPRLGQDKRGLVLQTIPGQIPSLNAIPTGCVFAPRCPVAIDRCFAEKPATEDTGDGRRVKCHRWREIAEEGLIFPEAIASTPQASVPARPSIIAERGELLTIRDLEVHYRRGGALAALFSRAARAPIKAVDGVSLEVRRGLTVGLVGESGSGKTSLARTVIGLVESNGGTVELLDADLRVPARRRAPETLQRLQMVFQNPEESLNPYQTVGETLRRPLITLAGKSAEEADAEVRRLLHAVHLPESYLTRLPSELSGGEKQRVAIARAFAASPDLIVADEPVSALDVSVQAAILNLLAELQAERQTAYLFISHDLAVVGYLADVIAVMYLGQIVELSDAAGFFEAPPHHPYTEALLSAIPVPDPTARQAPITLSGDIPSALTPPSGCLFHTRCPRCLGDLCRTVAPPWQRVTSAEGGREYRCHIPPEDLIALQQAPPPMATSDSATRLPTEQDTP